MVLKKGETQKAQRPDEEKIAASKESLFAKKGSPPGKPEGQPAPVETSPAPTESPAPVAAEKGQTSSPSRKSIADIQREAKRRTETDEEVVRRATLARNVFLKAEQDDDADAMDGAADSLLKRYDALLRIDTPDARKLVMFIDTSVRASEATTDVEQIVAETGGFDTVTATDEDGGVMSAERISEQARRERAQRGRTVESGEVTDTDTTDSKLESLAGRLNMMKSMYADANRRGNTEQTKRLQAGIEALEAEIKEIVAAHDPLLVVGSTKTGQATPETASDTGDSVLASVDRQVDRIQALNRLHVDGRRKASDVVDAVYHLSVIIDGYSVQNAKKDQEAEHKKTVDANADAFKVVARMVGPRIVEAARKKREDAVKAFDADKKASADTADNLEAEIDAALVFLEDHLDVQPIQSIAALDLFVKAYVEVRLALDEALARSERASAKTKAVYDSMVERTQSMLKAIGDIAAYAPEIAFAERVYKIERASDARQAEDGLDPRVVYLNGIIDAVNSDMLSIADANTPLIRQILFAVRNDKTHQRLEGGKAVEYFYGLTYNGTPLTDMINITPNSLWNTVLENGEVRIAAKAPGRFSLTNWNTIGKVFNLDGTSARLMDIGRVRLAVSAFVNKLTTRPTVSVFRNQEDLKTSNPALYAEAVASRAAGDFDFADAAGFSFGNDQVLIFTDRIANEAHLRFVLAHETLGHFGLRGVIPADTFDAVMTDVYNRDRVVRESVDIAMEMRGLSKAEAVEEYLADHAGHLAVSTVARVWSKVKSFLNKLGLRFGDDTARYLLDQANRYARYGRGGHFSTMSSIASRVRLVEQGMTPGAGRFSTVGSLLTENERIASILHQSREWPSLASAIEYVSTGRDKIKDFSDNWDTFQAKFLSLSNYRALRNLGASRAQALIGIVNQRNAAILRMANDKLESLYGSKTAVRDSIATMLYHTRIAASERFSHKDWTKPLLSIATDGSITADRAEIDRLITAGTLTFDQLKNGMKYDYVVTGLDGKPTKLVREVPAFPDLTKEQYEIYRSAREVIADVEAQFLQAKIIEAFENRRITFQQLASIMDNGKLDAESRLTLNAIADRYSRMYRQGIQIGVDGVPVFDTAAMKAADKFIKLVNAAFVTRSDDAEAQKRFTELSAVLSFATPEERSKLLDGLRAMKAKRRALAKEKDPDLFALQNAVKIVSLQDLPIADAERMTRQTIASGYFPFLRAGKFEVRVEAVGADGKRAAIHPDHKAMLVYTQVDSRSEAENTARELRTAFGDTKFTVLVDAGDGSYVPREVTLRAVSSEAVDAIAADPQLNLNEFMYGLNLFGIDLHPVKKREVVRTLTRQNSNARRRLKSGFTPGVDPKTAVMAISKHIEMRASQTAKTQVRTQFRDLLNLKNKQSARMWYGDHESVMRAYDLVQTTSNPHAKRLAQTELSRQLYMYISTNPGARGWDGSRANFTQDMAAPVDTNLGNRFYNEVARTIELMEAHKTVDDALGTTTEKVRSLTSIAALAVSVANGTLNLVSPYTNWMPYMASFNQRSGFGGGFSLGQAIAAYQRAHSQVGLLKAGFGSDYESATFYEKLLNDPARLSALGLADHEASALAYEIRAGKLIPAQTNALVATSAGSMFGANRNVRRLVDGIMSPFNKTEQAARRSAFLAAYRLQYDRVVAAAGRDTPEVRNNASKLARDFAVTSLDMTLGEYSQLNRPLYWRYGSISLLYMFKVYPTTVVHLLSNLDRKAAAAAIVGLWALAGLEGLPFAEDFEDMVDTLLQRLGPKLGIQQASVRKMIVELVEEIMPGMSPLVLRGVISYFMPDFGAASARMGMGNLIPGTGMLLAGANVAQELKEIAGPSLSTALGMGASLFNTASLPFATDKKQAAIDLLRESPVTVMRAVGDAIAYHSTGAVVDRRGYVVAPDAGAGTILARLAGFYPAAAAEQYQLVKYAQRVTDFQRSITTAYRQQWLKAKLRDDEGAAASIERSVEEWNAATQGTALEIRGFVRNSQRALREARRPAGERALRTTPNAAREDIEELFEALTD